MTESNLDIKATAREHLDYFKVIADHYRMDIQAVWQRATIFLAVNAALFAALRTDWLDKKEFPSADAVIIICGICIAAIVVNIIWWFAQYSTTLWIRRWRQALCNIDENLPIEGVYKGIFAKTENENQRCIRPQWTAFYLPAVLLIVWLVIMLFVLAYHGLGPLHQFPYGGEVTPASLVYIYDI